METKLKLVLLTCEIDRYINHVYCWPSVDIVPTLKLYFLIVEIVEIGERRMKLCVAVSYVWNY